MIKKLWIEGGSRTGKTSKLVNWVQEWMIDHHEPLTSLGKLEQIRQSSTKILCLVANDDTKQILSDRLIHHLSKGTEENIKVTVKTPLGWFKDEVSLFYPLICDGLGIKTYFPCILRPETEQFLATELWKPRLSPEICAVLGVTEYRLVRTTLDLLQLAASSGMQITDIPDRLITGFGQLPNHQNLVPIYNLMGQLLQQWKDWCLHRGLLTYGLINDLYWQCLLPNSIYQSQLLTRYQCLIGDDVDDYPAIALHLAKFFLTHDLPAAFSYNLDGSIKLGLSADPHCLYQLKQDCERWETLPRSTPPIVTTATTLTTHPISNDFIDELVGMVLSSQEWIDLPPNIQTIKSTTRGELLTKVTTEIIEAVKSGNIHPEDIAIITPGTDAIARHTLTNIFTQHQIPLTVINEQRPLNTSPLIGSLLTLFSFVYPDLGKLINNNQVSQMLTVLSMTHPYPNYIIDPLRAGLIADHCYLPHISCPQLLPLTHFPRWDRIGLIAKNSYEDICSWIELQREQSPEPIILLMRAIAKFFPDKLQLPYAETNAIRELLETANHYWEVQNRLRQTNSGIIEPIIAQFIQLLTQGTIAANPYPLPTITELSRGITLANIYQYRSLKTHHRWQFWLDVGSSFWSQSSLGMLYGSMLFWHDQQGKTWTSQDSHDLDQQKLGQIMRDLLNRVDQKLYLCHSDLAINGQLQTGILLTLLR